MKVTASDLLRLLEAKHSKDVFVPECKDGPTVYGSHVRLDGWAMKKSWASPCVTGYEIKVSRGDFTSDQKWHSYLPLCNQLYFVCPQGLLDPSEVPGDVGLLVASKNAAKLFVKKKAAHREVEIPESLWRYIVMCRAVITREQGDVRSKREFWEAWLKKKEINQRFGRHVASELRKEIEDRIVKAEKENERLEALMRGYEDVRQVLAKIGLDPDRRQYSWTVERKLREAKSAIPPGLAADLDALAKKAAKVRDALESIEAEGGQSGMAAG